MRWKKETREEKRARKNGKLQAQWDAECKWHRYFAWFPVEVAPNETVWLETVERRITERDQSIGLQWYYWDVRDFEYRKLEYA